MKAFVLVAALTLVACGLAKPHVIPDPEIRFVVWGGRDPAPLEADWTTLCSSDVFNRLVEYGVHGCHLGPTTQALPDLGAGEVSDPWVLEQLRQEVRLSPGIIHVVVLPDGATTAGLVASASRGYHLWLGGPYAVVPNDELLISHEIYEAATDPDGLGYRWGFDKEIGDYCQGLGYEVGGVIVQKVWSQQLQVCL